MSDLQVVALSKVFGGLRATDDVSFSIEAGTVNSIIGPNGAGKTTLLNLITGIYEPSSGDVRLGGKSLIGKPTHVRVGMGLGRTFQTPQICHNMSAIENVMLGSHLQLDSRLAPAALRRRSIVSADKQCRARAAELMNYVGLGRYLEESPGAMPYGALKRLEIARALAGSPKLILLDEPAAGLGAPEKAELSQLISKLSESGVTTVLVEHDMKLVMSVSKHIVVLNYGKKLAEGTPDVVRDNPEVIAAYLGRAA
ncbi:MAG: ABC transporter ATP-binding protein [Thauera sp.]|nr:ABC transporter ATP-binding protein [Thauera sp.]